MDFRQLKAIESANKKKLLKLFPTLTEDSGIYILYRFEDGIKYAYVGQAKHLLTRLADHLKCLGKNVQWIDKSLKTHGLYSEQKATGWRVTTHKYPLDELDEKEQFFIKECQRAGYQMRNMTAGGQGEGKVRIAEFKPAKGYYDGLKQGRENLRKELAHIVNTYLNIELKKDGKIAQRMLAKFQDLLKKQEKEEEEHVANQYV